MPRDPPGGAVVRACLGLPDINNLLAAYDAALIAACALADTLNGPAITLPALLLNGWLTGM